MKRIVVLFIIMVLMLIAFISVDAAETHMLKVNTEGLGEISVVEDGMAVIFYPDHPIQSAVENAEEGSKYTIGVRAGEGYKFKKWTLNGQDYSNDILLSVTLNSDMDLVSVFEPDGSEGQVDEVTIDENYDTFVKGDETKNTVEETQNKPLIYIGFGSIAAIIVIVGIYFIIKNH